MVSISLDWRLVVSAPPAVTGPSLDLLFKRRPTTRLFRQFGVPASASVPPVQLEPQGPFWNALSAELGKLGVDVTGNKAPLKLGIEGGRSLSISLALRRYPTGVLALSVRARDLGSPRPFSPDEIIALQRAVSGTGLSSLARIALKLGVTADHKDRVPIPGRVETHSSTSLELDEPVGSFLEENRSALAGIAINNLTFSRSAPELADRLLAKNREHNLKNQDTLVLYDKQGLLSVAGTHDSGSARHDEAIRRAHDLVELALVFRSFLRSFRQRQQVSRFYSAFLLGRILPWISEPEVVLADSVSTQFMWDLVMDEFRLQGVASPLVSDQSVLEDIKYVDELLRHEPGEWWLDDSFAGGTEQKAARTLSSSLDFIATEAYRQVLADDLAEAERSRIAGNYKASVVLSGSLAEALLLYVLEEGVWQEGWTSKKPLQNMGLQELHQSAAEVGILKSQATRNMLEAVREWRNLVHPGRVARTGELAPTRDTAEAAIAAVKILAAELRMRVPSGAGRNPRPTGRTTP